MAGTGAAPSPSSPAASHGAVRPLLLLTNETTILYSRNPTHLPTPRTHPPQTSYVRIKRKNQTFFISVPEPSASVAALKEEVSGIVGVEPSHIRFFGPDKVGLVVCA